MKKRIILILALLASSMSNLFAQFEVMTSEQAKKELSENLSLTSAEVDQMISKYLIPFSDEMLQNGLGLRDIDPYLFNDIIGIKFFVAKAYGFALCVNHSDSTLSIQKFEPGYYTISQKLLFKEQIERRTNDLLNFYLMSSSKITLETQSFDKYEYNEFCDSNVVKCLFKEIIEENSASKKGFQSSLLKGTYKGTYDRYDFNSPYNRSVIILTDEKGRDFYIPEDIGKSTIYIGRPELNNSVLGNNFTKLRYIKGYPNSYLEKLDAVLKNQECYLSTKKNFYTDPISKETKPIPEQEKTYKCERLIMADGELFGVFSNDTGNYSVKIGPIQPYLIDQYGKSKPAEHSGGYYFYENGTLISFDYLNRALRYDNCTNAIFAYDGHIEGGDISIIPKSFIEKKNQLEKEVWTSLEAAAAKSRKEYEQGIEQERKANIEKYGTEFGGNINNRKVALGMTKEMCQKSWGYPSERYSKVNPNGTLEIWVYYSATLSFMDGKLVQIDKW